MCTQKSCAGGRGGASGQGEGRLPEKQLWAVWRHIVGWSIHKAMKWSHVPSSVALTEAQSLDRQDQDSTGPRTVGIMGR
jgi:hypothetical protein